MIRTLAFHSWANSVTEAAHNVTFYIEQLREGRDRWEELADAGRELDRLLTHPPEWQDEPT